MANRIIRVVIAIVVVVAVLFGIYKALPKQYSGKIDMAYQQLTDKNAKAIVEKFQNAKMGKSDVTYKDGFDKATADPSWKVETVNEASGNYNVIIDGYKVTLNIIKDDNSGDTWVSTNAHVRVVMNVTYTADTAKILSIKVFVNDEIQNDSYKAQIIEAIAKDASK